MLWAYKSYKFFHAMILPDSGTLAADDAECISSLLMNRFVHKLMTLNLSMDKEF